MKKVNLTHRVSNIQLLTPPIAICARSRLLEASVVEALRHSYFDRPSPMTLVIVNKSQWLSEPKWPGSQGKTAGPRETGRARAGQFDQVGDTKKPPDQNFWMTYDINDIRKHYKSICYIFIKIGVVQVMVVTGYRGFNVINR